MFSLRGLRLYFPALEPWVTRSASLPAVHLVYLCENVGPRGATLHSACPVLHHSESGPLSLSVRECGVTGSASGQTACPVGPTLRQSRSCQGNCSPLRPDAGLRPSYWSGCMFLFYLLGVGLPYCSIFCQFWLCRRRSVSTYAAILVLHLVLIEGLTWSN